jgi:hypothetical protein
MLSIAEFTRKVPDESLTTFPAGQAANAAFMASAASCAPFPNVAASIVAEISVLMGRRSGPSDRPVTPSKVMPGSHIVARSVGRREVCWDLAGFHRGRNIAFEGISLAIMLISVRVNEIKAPIEIRAV